MAATQKNTLSVKLASLTLLDAWTDFYLSRQAMNCTANTLAFYQKTTGAFLAWLEGQSITDPSEITARHVRAYLAGIQGKDTTRHAYARAVKTLLRFWHAEGYMPAPVTFEMPKLEKKRLPVLTAEQLRKIVSLASVRDRAIVLFMADSGLRRGEVVRLNWDDVDMQTGRVRVRLGKGQKDRSSVIGAKTRRALLSYRRTIENRDGPLFQTKAGGRFTGNGLMMLFRRLAKRTGILITAHALRRTFTILSLRAGMSPLHLQNLGGWASLDMVQHYAQMEDEDLLQAHRKSSPIDNL